MLLSDSPSPQGELYKDHPLLLGPREARGQIMSQWKRRRHKAKNLNICKQVPGAHIPPLFHCTELGKSVLHCSAAVSIAIERQLKGKNPHAESSLPCVQAAPFTEITQFSFPRRRWCGKAEHRDYCLRMTFPYSLGILKGDCLVRAGYFQAFPSFMFLLNPWLKWGFCAGEILHWLSPQGWIAARVDSDRSRWLCVQISKS